MERLRGLQGRAKACFADTDALADVVNPDSAAGAAYQTLNPPAPAEAESDGGGSGGCCGGDADGGGCGGGADGGGCSGSTEEAGGGGGCCGGVAGSCGACETPSRGGGPASDSAEGLLNEARLLLADTKARLLDGGTSGASGGQ